MASGSSASCAFAPRLCNSRERVFVSRQSHAVIFKYALQLLFWLSCMLPHCGACFLSGGAEPGFPPTRSLHGDALVPVSSSVYRSTMVISVCKCFSTAKKLLPNFRCECPGRIFTAVVMKTSHAAHIRGTAFPKYRSARSRCTVLDMLVVDNGFKVSNGC